MNKLNQNAEFKLLIFLEIVHLISVTNQKRSPKTKTRQGRFISLIVKHIQKAETSYIFYRTYLLNLRVLDMLTCVIQALRKCYIPIHYPHSHVSCNTVFWDVF